MIRVHIGNNVDHYPVAADPNATLKSVLEANGIDYSKGSMSLDGATLKPGDLEKTFNDFGVTSQCFLLSIQKLD